MRKKLAVLQLKWLAVKLIEIKLSRVGFFEFKEGGKCYWMLIFEDFLIENFKKLKIY